MVLGQVDPEDSRDLFLVDRQSGTSQLVTYFGDHVTCGPGDSLEEGAMSDDGSVVAFLSREEGLVVGFDTLGFSQAYSYCRNSCAIVARTRSASDPSRGGNRDANGLDVDGAGPVAVVSSNATDLLSGFVDGGPGADAYGFSLATGSPLLITADAANPG